MGKMETQSKSSVIKWFSPLLTTAILLLIFHATEAKDCQLVGPGACRGLKWSEGTWPQLVQDRTIDECCTLCKSTRSLRPLVWAKEPSLRNLVFYTTTKIFNQHPDWEENATKL